MTPPSSSHPFDALTPDVVLDALSAIGRHGDGRLTALNSFENRVYQAHLEDGSAVVLKFYRPERWSAAQILEEHHFAQALAAGEVPVVAPLTQHDQTLHTHNGFMFSVSPRKGGRRPELDDLDVMAWIGRFLGRLHVVGAREAFVHRPALDIAQLGEEPRDWLLRHHIIPPESERLWRDTLDRALDAVAAAFAQAGQVATLRLHGDCHPGNILWTPSELPGGGPHFVDLDDARNGPAVQDLWMLLGGDRAQQTRQLGALVDGYEEFRDFDRRELTLIEPLRTLRLIHYSAWLARRWSDPIFPINFPWFGTPAYWNEQALWLAQQVDAMAAPPLVV